MYNLLLTHLTIDPPFLAYYTLCSSFGIYALATCFAIAGFVMSYIANFQCNFIEFNDGSSSLKFGVWAYDTSRYGCKGYVSILLQPGQSLLVIVYY